MTSDHVHLLRCPMCQGPLVFLGASANGRLHTGELACARCPRAWPVRDGIPRLLETRDVHGFETIVRMVYQLFAPFHDLGVRYGLPLATFTTEEEGRERYMRYMELEALAREAREDRPVRILDVGIGGGGNLPHIAFHLPAGVDAEIWGVDYSPRMLRQCERRLDDWDGPPVHLGVADAHHLPFADGLFDRVVHVGAIATYRDPKLALREMARVARPATPIVVVDEQLDPRAGWYQWAMFHWITMLDTIAHAPVEHLPPAATDVSVTQASSFFYCLRFRVPAAGDPDATVRRPGPTPHRPRAGKAGPGSRTRRELP